MTTLEAASSHIAVQAKQPIILGPGEGTKTLNLFGQPMIVRVPREATNNQLWLSEYTIKPHFPGPQPHVHLRSYEVFLVLEGELGMLAGEERITVQPGGLVMVTPGTRHTFYNETDQPCRFIGITTPGDLGAYLEKLPEVAEKYGFPPPADIAAALAEEYDGGIFSTAP